MRIAVAGFQHETNTFAPMRAGYEDFVKADAWPGLTRGGDIPAGLGGMNLPLAGFLEAAPAQGFEALPILWCSAEPSAQVSDDAFDRISGEICDGLRALWPFDAIYLDLHGAMVTEGHQDGEGELLRRIRQVVGTKIPLVISLDLHANLTPEMVEHSDAMTIFRSYPHLDMAETGARAAPLLRRVIDRGRPAKAYRQAPFLTPLTAQHTGSTPSRELYGLLENAPPAGVINSEIAAGFPPADIYHSGPAVVAYADDQTAADTAADALLGAFEAAEAEFEGDLLEPIEAVRRAMAADPTGGPIVLADVQDNPGAGATSDTTGLIQALVAGGAQGAVVALLHDPEVAVWAMEAGERGVFHADLGGKAGGPGNGSFESEFRVEALSDGRFDFTGVMYGGARAELGPTVLLRIENPDCDVRVIVGSERCQCLDQAIFSHIGVVPGEQRILGIKSTVHFRADFEGIAKDIWTVACPGAHPCRLADLPYRNLRPGIRLGPLGPAFQPR